MQRSILPVVFAVSLMVALLGVLMALMASPVALAQSSNTSTPTWTSVPSATPSVVTTTAQGAEGVPIPPYAVVGRVVQGTLLYWRPSADAVVPLVLGAGKTAWVLGVDASGRYYKIVWANRYLWVPVEAMEPNDDAVWHGAPLPTEVVE